jgi:hypothetical protein
VATRDLEPWGIYQGNPAAKKGERRGQREERKPSELASAGSAKKLEA